MLTFVKLGLLCFFSVEMLRALPVLRELRRQGVKPLACDLCMSFWTSLILVPIWLHYFATLHYGALLSVWLPTGGLCLVLLRQFSGMPFVTVPPPEADK